MDRIIFWFSSCLLALFLCFFIQSNAQTVSPSIPPTVVQERASQTLLQGTITPCDRACASIASKLPSQLFLRKSGDFEIWDAKQADVTPACRVEPASAEDVSFVVKTVTEEGCHFAVKSGGHARDTGFSNADAGVTIDLIRMGGVKLSKDKKSVQVGAGARWLDVYISLEKDNLTVIGGRAADVGVGGLTLGGGISFFSARHGWTCDSVISYEIVLPDATVTTVTSQSHRDLYFALRGAGQVNFGIVTSFTYETIPLPNPAGLWHANKMYSFDKVPEVIQAWHTVQTESLPKDLDIGGFNIHIYGQAYDSWFVIDHYVHTVHTDASSWPEIFTPFEKIDAVPDTTHISVRPYSNITVDIASFALSGKRNVYATFTYFPSVELTTKLLEIHQEEVTPIKAAEDLLPCLILQPLAQNSVALMSKNGGNALGLKSSDGTLVILSIAWSWKNAADDAAIFAAYHKFFARAEAAAKEMGLWHRYKYANYAEASQDVWAGYGEESLKRLRKVQREVDPKGVFVKGGLGGAGFKLNVKEEVVREGGAAEKATVTDQKSEL